MRKELLLIILCAFLGHVSRSQAVVDSVKSPPQFGKQLPTQKTGLLSIHSNPEGAEIVLGQTLIGKAPLERLSVDEGKILLKLYYPSVRAWNAATKNDTLTIVRGQELKFTVDLDVPPAYGMVKSDISTFAQRPELFVVDSKDENSKSVLTYCSGGAMILTGILSAYLKNQSDRDFDAYIATGDAGKLSSTHNLDRLAGITLVVTEISFGVLTYLLLSE